MRVPVANAGRDCLIGVFGFGRYSFFQTERQPPSRYEAIMAKNLVLIGFMGTGKSTAGRQCARILDRPFLDTDALLVERAGKPIPQIFAEDGEAAFRDWERRIVAEVAGQGDKVISTGGGAMLNPDNARVIRDSSCVVLLTAKTFAIMRRVGDRRNRPMLANVSDPYSHVVELGAKRSPFYELSADALVDTTDRPVDEVVQEILAWYEQITARQAQHEEV